MTLRITVSLRETVVGSYAFEKDRVTLGRASSCDVVLDNLALSRTHAELVHERGEWVLKDLGSRNGVWVNGQRKPIHAVLNGDVLGLGKFSVTVTYDGEPPVQAAKSEADPYAALGGHDRVLGRPRGRKTGTRRAARASGSDAMIAQAPWAHPAIACGAHLIVKRGEPLGVFALERDVFTVGGHKSCELRLGGTLAPRRLAMIVRGLGGYSLVNVSSRPESVWRNGKPVTDRCWLEDGDRLEFDDVLVRFATGPAKG
jgi:pSer/pThr/pTyr-binding forkhead associated (FHA) protein